MERQKLRPIVHIHIPKTGGSTFGHRMASALPAERVWIDQGDIEQTESGSVLKQIASRKMIFASAHITGHALVDEKRFDYVALIRNPVDQIISNLRHIQREPTNTLHELSLRLPFEDFFGYCAEWFFNVQARYLVAAHNEPTNFERLLPDERWLVKYLHSTCDRINWLAPTEDLDSFYDLFSIELGLSNPSVPEDRNQAPVGASQDIGAVRQWLLRHPELYAVDTLLHNEARRRFDIYRQASRTALTPAKARLRQISKDSATLFSSAAGSVQLIDGWIHRDESEDWGTVYHAGPGRDSRLLVKHRASGRHLHFAFLFGAGILPEELLFIDETNGDLLPVALEQQDGITHVHLTLADTQDETAITIRAPRIFPLCKFDERWDDNRTPVLFGAAGWNLTGETTAKIHPKELAALPESS